MAPPWAAVQMWVDEIPERRARGNANPIVMPSIYPVLVQVAKATYAVMGLLIAYQVLKPKKK